MRRPRRAGFTLVEVSVALLLAAIALAGARVTLGAMVDHAAAITAAGRETLVRGNGERTLRALALHAEAGTDTSAAFGGTATGVVFDSWCLTPRGWRERCRVALTLDRDAADPGRYSLRAWLPELAPLELLEVPAPARFAFLEDPVHGGTWSATWGPSVVAPSAIGVFSEGDTLILRIGVNP
jgi:prepilin-type N-terminal cleavage/methylation domain-containing protein